MEGFIKIDGEDSVCKTIGEVGNKIYRFFKSIVSFFQKKTFETCFIRKKQGY